MSRPKRLLVRGARVLTLDPELGELERGDIRITGDVIEAVAPELDATGCEVIEARGRIALPGFVDAHRHTWQTPLRSVAADWTLFDYTVRMRMIYASFLTPEDVYLGNRCGALEALSAGITTLVDHCHAMNSPEHADAALDGLLDSGLRAIFCYGLHPNPGHDPFRLDLEPGWRKDDVTRMRRDRLSADGGLVRLGLAPSEVEYVPFEQVRDELRLGRAIGAHTVSCHVGMGWYDRGGHLVRRLAQDSLLGPDLLFVHGSALEDDEIRALADAGAALVATPETELQMGMGAPVAVRAARLGVRAGLGIDIVSHGSGDPFAPMRLLLQAQRHLDHEAARSAPRCVGLRAREVLELAILGGARALGLEDEIGSITPGKRADLVLLGCDGLHGRPVHDAAAAVVLQANAHDVRTVLVGGRIVKREGILQGVDEGGLAAELERSGTRIRGAATRARVEEVESLVAPLMLGTP